MQNQVEELSKDEIFYLKFWQLERTYKDTKSQAHSISAVFLS